MQLIPQCEYATLAGFPLELQVYTCGFFGIGKFIVSFVLE